MIHVVATVEISEGQREEFLAIFLDNVPKVRGEDGCLEYTPAVDIDADIAAQPPARKNVVTVVEKWSDLDALKAHLVAPHMVTYREQVKDLVRGATIHVLEPAG